MSYQRSGRRAWMSNTFLGNRAGIQELGLDRTATSIKLQSTHMGSIGLPTLGVQSNSTNHVIVANAAKPRRVHHVRVGISMYCMHPHNTDVRQTSPTHHTKYGVCHITHEHTLKLQR